MKLSRRSGRLMKTLRSEPGQVSRNHHDQARRIGVMTVMGAIWLGLAAIASALERFEDVGEHVAVRAPPNQHVEVAEALELEDRVLAGLLGVELLPGAPLAFGKEKSVAKAGEERKAGSVRWTRRQLVLAQLRQALHRHEMPGLGAAPHLAKEGKGCIAELAREPLEGLRVEVGALPKRLRLAAIEVGRGGIHRVGVVASGK